MRKVSLATHTLLLIAGLTSFVLVYRGLWPIQWLLLLQLVLGAWQVSNAVFALMQGDHLYKYKLVHLGVSCMYLVSLIAYFSQGNPITLPSFLPAWLLAIYYYVLSCMGHGRNRRSGSFLPHLSF